MNLKSCDVCGKTATALLNNMTKIINVKGVDLSCFIKITNVGVDICDACFRRVLKLLGKSPEFTEVP